MLLNDIGKSPDATFRRINQHLEANYGFKISESVSDKDLVSIMEQIEDEITDLKIRGDDAKASAEISKRLLVLEGVKTLREFTLAQFQSPKLNHVVSSLVDYVVKTFEISGYIGAPEFERAVQNAMDEYRSSRYRFPDDIIEQRVRSEAMQRIQADQGLGADETNPLPGAEFPMMEQTAGDIGEIEGIEEMGDWRQEGKRSSALGSRTPVHHEPDPEVMKRFDTLNVGLDPMSEPEPEIHDPWERQKRARQQGVYTPPKPAPAKPFDPWEAQAEARRKGIVTKESDEGIQMNEHKNLVKNLRRLLETEVSQAEVMMAAKGFAQELQEMVEKIGRLQNEDLPPVTDQMRETYGMESASAFQTQIYGALQGVMDSLYTAKNQVDDAVSNMASTGQVTASTDMEKPMGMDGMDAGMDDMDAEMDSDLDNIAADLDSEDEFGGAEEEEPLGRAMKTEAVLQRKVMEMQRLVAKARKLKESKKRA